MPFGIVHELYYYTYTIREEKEKQAKQDAEKRKKEEEERDRTENGRKRFLHQRPRADSYVPTPTLMSPAEQAKAINEQRSQHDAKSKAKENDNQTTSLPPVDMDDIVDLLEDGL